MPPCPFCGAQCASDGHLRRHIAASEYCSAQELALRSQLPPVGARPIDIAEPAAEPQQPVAGGVPRRHPSVIIEDVPEGEEEAGARRSPTPDGDAALDNEDFANGFYYGMAYPSAHAGQPINDIHTPTAFENNYRLNLAKGHTRYYPFPSKEEWDIAAFLTRELNHRQIDGMLKMPSVSLTSHVSD